MEISTFYLPVSRQRRPIAAAGSQKSSHGPSNNQNSRAATAGAAFTQQQISVSTNHYDDILRAENERDTGKRDRITNLLSEAGSRYGDDEMIISYGHST